MGACRLASCRESSNPSKLGEERPCAEGKDCRPAQTEAPSWKSRGKAAGTGKYLLLPDSHCMWPFLNLFLSKSSLFSLRLCAAKCICWLEFEPQAVLGPWGSGFPARGSMALLTCLLPLRLGSQHSLPDLPLWKGEAEAQLGAGGNRAPSRASTVGTRAFSVHGHFVVFGLVSSCWHAFLRNNSVSNCFLYNTESCPP